eukprot:TRINITY_DN7446_c0_g1_i1.p1 TRINITY_DN7446_c0_g1~~TRINITY_DN7446_c0_g1_i1.p1  ORF type:complete len:528 (-),score=178.76 TRINITY_DN7446_c0_g1_i1:94-1626(-)
MAAKQQQQVPTVMDEALLRRCIDDPKPKGAAAGADAPFGTVRTLKFSFLSIGKIDNLVGFSQLTTLKIDNNEISKIENLGHLVHLTWLDLSFNKIKKIEGLEQLTQLQDLSLCSNQIRVLEGMDALTNIQTFSIKNNLIDNINNLAYLRRFKKLAVLNLLGNPIPEAEYSVHVMAHLDGLQFLDHHRIDDIKRQTARDRYGDAIRALTEAERLESQQKQKEQTLQNSVALLKESNLLGVENLFANIMKDDTDLNNLSVLTTVAELKEEYREKWAQLTDDFKAHMLELHRNRIDERTAFNQACQHVAEENRQHCMKLISKFDSRVRHAIAGLPKSADAEKERVALTTKLHDENKALIDDLLEQEVQLCEQMKAFINSFDAKMSDMGSAIVSTIQAYFTKIRDFETNFHERLGQMVMQDYDKYQKGELVDIPEKTKLLLAEKETLSNYLSGSHDAQALLIESLLEEMKKAESATLEQFMAGVKTDENTRDRERSAEIWLLSEYNKRLIDQTK